MIAQNILRTFTKKYMGFDVFFDVTKCIQQIEIPELLHMFTSWSELPSGISTIYIPVGSRGQKAGDVSGSLREEYIESL